MIPVILAGGDGLRMRPLTCSLPKALLPVADANLLEIAVATVVRNHFEKCIISADYLSSQMTELYDKLSMSGTDIDFSVLSIPVGTTTAITVALKNINDTALILPCDVVHNFRIDEFIKFHRSSKADVSVIVKRNIDCDGKCGVYFDKHNVIRKIIKSPSEQNNVGIAVMTGICILSENAVLTAGMYNGDFITETLPLMLKNGMRICAFEESGYSLDVNTPQDLLNAQYDALSAKFVLPKKLLSKNYGDNIQQPVFIDKTAVIDKTATISAGTVICANVTVEKHAKVRGGLLLNGAYIGERASVNNAVIGSSARLLSSSAVFEGAVVGENAVVANGAVVNPCVRIWNGKHVESDTNAVSDIKYGFAKPLKLDDEGICGETNGLVTPQIASALGSTLASVGNRVAVGYRDTDASHSLALAIASGIMSAGGECWMFSQSCETELGFCVQKCNLDIGCFVDAGVTAKLKFVSSDGLPVGRNTERIIENGLNRNEYRKCGYTHFGTIKPCNDIKSLYVQYLRGLLPLSLAGMNVCINTASERIETVCRELFDGVNDRNGERIIFHISSDAKKITAYTEETGYIFYEKLVLLCCLKCFESGIDVAVPYSFPSAVDRLAQQYNRKVLRFSTTAQNNDETQARQQAVSLMFTTDAMVLMLTILDILSTEKKSLKDAVSRLPSFSASVRYVPLEKQQTEALSTVCTEEKRNGDGYIFDDSRGRVLIRPVKTGKGVMMYVESFNAETAGEICDFYYNMLTKLKNK